MKFFLLLLLVTVVALLSAIGGAVSADSDGFEESIANSEIPPSDDDLDLEHFRSPGMEDYGDDPYGDEGSDPTPPASAKELQSLEEIDAFVQEAQFEPAVIGYFDASANKDDLDSFQELATTDGHSFRFAFTTNKEVLEQKKYDGCAVFVYPPPKYVNEKLERAKYRYPGKNLSPQKVLDFVKAKSIPLAGEVTMKSRATYEAAKKPVVTVFAAIDHERNSKGFNYLANRVRKVAKKYEGKVIFSLANTDSFTYAMESDYGFEDVSAKETVVGLRDGDVFFKMTDKFSVENLGAFVDKFLAGQLEGKKKQESHAEEDDEEEDDDSSSPVTVATSDNFATLVDQSSADVMLEFYAPWCGHCRALKPEYKKVAQHFSDDDGVTVAAFDATAHSVPASFDVQGYPTLFFVPANDKKNPIPYEGPRSSKDIIQFIESHRSTTKSGHSEF